MTDLILPVELITAEAFAPFGELVHAGNARIQLSMNGGTAQRYLDVAQIDVGAAHGRAQLSWCSARGQPFPLQISMLERHPLGSQAFIPVQPHPYLVVVATSPIEPPRAFRVERGIGVNYARGTWHHPLLAMSDTDFWILDRAGEGANCDVQQLPRSYVIEMPAQRSSS